MLSSYGQGTRMRGLVTSAALALVLSVPLAAQADDEGARQSQVGQLASLIQSIPTEPKGERATPAPDLVREGVIDDAVSTMVPPEDPQSETYAWMQSPTERYAFGYNALAAIGAEEAKPGAAVPARPQFERTIANAVFDHPEFKAALAGERGAGFAVDEAKGARLPRVDIGVTGRVSDFNTTTTDLDGSLRKSGIDTDVDAYVTASQAIYKGGSINARIGQAKADRATARFRAEAIAQNLAIELITASHQLAYARAALMLSDRSVSFHEAVLDKVKLRHDRGVSSIADVARTEARLSTAAAELATAAAEVDVAEADYEALFGRKPGVLGLADPGRVYTTADGALNDAQTNMPEMKWARSRLTSAEKMLETAQGDRLPQVGLDASAVRYDNIDNNPRAGYSVRLSAKYKVFEGGARAARINRAREGVAEAQHQFAAQQRDVGRMARGAFEQAQAAVRRVTVLSSARDSQQQARDLIFEQFKQSGRSLFDVLDAERDFVASERALLDAKRTAAVANYRVLAQTGQLLELMAGAGDGLPARSQFSEHRRIPRYETGMIRQDELIEPPAEMGQEIARTPRTPVKMSAASDAPETAAEAGADEALSKVMGAPDVE